MHVRTFPSHDLAFRKAVEFVLDSEREPDPRNVESKLRLVYPRVALVARHVSGDQGRYYAYRDGRILPEADERWWSLPETARVTISAATGLVTSVSDASSELMKGPSSQLVGIHFADFLMASARDLGASLFETVVRGGEVRSQAVVQRFDGGPVAVEFRAVRDGDEIEVACRPLPTD